MKGYILRILLAFLAITIAMTPINFSYAKKKSNKKKRRTSIIDFEDELIEGAVKSPELFYLLQQKQFKYKRLIKLREDFLSEMRQAAEDLPRGGDSD